MTTLFGTPLTLPTPDVEAASSYLRGLWQAVYQKAPDSDVDADLERCRRFFDPLLREQTVRQRLAAVHPFPKPPDLRSVMLRVPVVINIDATRRLVGVEGRLLLAGLEDAREESGLCLIDAQLAQNLTARALDSYRRWSGRRLAQVIELQSGRGREPLRANSVGLVLAMLLNRSTDRSRALVPAEGDLAAGAERAVFQAAEAFASRLGMRNDRSSTENRLRGGYAVTEARRRLTDFEIVPGTAVSAPAYFLRPGSESRVLDVLASELSRRSKVSQDTLGAAFDDLVAAFRAVAARDGWLGGFHERAADTAGLRRRLIDSYQRAAAGSETDG